MARETDEQIKARLEAKRELQERNSVHGQSAAYAIAVAKGADVTVERTSNERAKFLVETHDKLKRYKMHGTGDEALDLEIIAACGTWWQGERPKPPQEQDETTKRQIANIRPAARDTREVFEIENGKKVPAKSERKETSDLEKMSKAQLLKLLQG